MAKQNLAKFEFEISFVYISCIGTSPRMPYLFYLLSAVHSLPEKKKRTALHKQWFKDETFRFTVMNTDTAILKAWSDSLTVRRPLGSPYQGHLSRRTLLLQPQKFNTKYFSDQNEILTCCTLPINGAVLFCVTEIVDSLTAHSAHDNLLWCNEIWE